MNSVSRYNQTLHQYNQTLHQYKSARICENTENTENRYTGNVDSVEKSLPEIFKKIKIKQKTHSRGLYLPINVEWWVLYDECWMMMVDEWWYH